jgi:hypothetical protein
MASKYTNALLGMVEEGLLNVDDVLNMALQYLGETDVRGMLQANDIDLFNEWTEVEDEDEEADEEEDLA